ncbi:GGDEF domain-containing phosphodiesterase [Citromicrobium bathyomarinum]
MIEYAETLSTQSSDYAERIYVEALRKSIDNSFADIDVNTALQLSETVRPLLARLANLGTYQRSDTIEPLIRSVTHWCEQSVGPLPPGFESLLTEKAPNGRRPWLVAFQGELATELLQNTAFEKLLIISHLSEAAESGIVLLKSAQALQTSLQKLDESIGDVANKVSHIIVQNDDQIAQLRRLSSLVHQLGNESNAELLSRVLTNSMFSPSGDVTPTALILISIFSTYSIADSFTRTDKQLLFRQVTGRLSQAAGEMAFVGRYDGGEFDIIIKEVRGLSDAEKRCANIAAAFFSPFIVSGATFTLSPKIGLALSPDHGFSPDILQRNADLALRSAMSFGAPDIVIYTSELHENAEERRRLEADLERAVWRDQLRLVFQPIISLSTSKITGYEALVRWDHPDHGVISPAKFIPLAEDAGIITDIDDWVFSTASHIAARWPDNLQLAVNVSAVQFSDPSFAKKIGDLIHKARIDAGRIELEITESVFLEDQKRINSIFRDLRDIGIRISLDDFGTGYSSLGYLKKGQIDKIKIDSSFIRAASLNESGSLATIEAIVSFAKISAMEVTAEGIETEDEMKLAEIMSCDYAQGYLFGRPIQAEEIQVRTP